MAGATILATFDDAELRDSVRRLERLGQNLLPVARAIGVGMVRNVQDRFSDGKDPDGHPWAKLHPATMAMKRGPGILRESGMRGGLMGSITFRTSGGATGGAAVIVGTNKIYGAIHQFGGTIVPKKPGGRLIFRTAGGQAWGAANSVTIPARPFLGFSREDRETVADVLQVFVARALRG